MLCKQHLLRGGAPATVAARLCSPPTYILPGCRALCSSLRLFPSEETQSTLHNGHESPGQTGRPCSSQTTPDQDALQKATAWIARQPPLVFAGECRTLQAHLAKCAAGEAFLLQGGDCAESFKDFSADRIRDTFRVMLQMSVVMTFGGSIPVVKMGRMAGQFAKPRSSPMEKCGDRQLPSYRGDIINGPEQTEEARIPNPERLKEAYNQSSSTPQLATGLQQRSVMRTMCTVKALQSSS